MKNNILQDLKDYFKNTPREQIEKDWAETEKYDKVGPTVSEFLEVTKSEPLDGVYKSVFRKQTRYLRKPSKT